jgi:hypothetical protein
VQLENEYDYAGLPDDVMINQVKALGEAARAGGIDVPLFTCWTHPVRGSTDLLRQVFDACNFIRDGLMPPCQKEFESAVIELAGKK